MREIREVIREEPAMRRPILGALEGGPCSVPELAQALHLPEPELMVWLMGMRKYNLVAEEAGPGEDGYFRYRKAEP